jgi:hypothetical protein
MLLDVKLNLELLRSGKIVFGSVVGIADLHTWDDENIIQLAYAAHEARRDNYRENESKIRRAKQRKGPQNPAAQNPTAPTADADSSWLPVVTTTLVVNDMAYIATSLKGGAFLYQMSYQEPRWVNLDNKVCGDIVKNALKKCQAKAPLTDRVVKGQKKGKVRAGHRTGANCGEPLAVQSFCRAAGSPQIENLDGAKIIAIQDRLNEEGKLEAIIVPPCGGGKVTRPA